MDKKVFCSLQGRSKCVKFQRDPSVSDVAIIRDKIRDICERDTCLKKFIENKVIVSQIPLDSEISVDEKKIDQSKKMISIVKTGPGSIKMPAILPSLTYDLKKKVEDLGVLASQKDLIYHWASFLWETTDGQPMKIYYQNLASTIVSAYPLLKGGPKGYVRYSEDSIKYLDKESQNHIKKQGKRNAEENINHVPKMSKVEVSNETSEVSTLNVSRALLELEKKQGKEGNTLHVQRLIKLTLNERLNWIKNEAKSILEVVRKYPHLNDCDSILFEFYNLKNTTEDSIFKNIQLMFFRLKNYFQVKDEGENFEIDLVIKLNDAVTRKVKKEVKPLFTFKQARSSTDCLVTEENESPRAIIYSDNKEISAAFIVADTNVRVQVSNPTVPKVVATLLAAYYVWDTVFPKQYLNMLEYIDSEVLGTIIKKNQVLLKFIRKREEKEKEEENK
ncbi:hypothetical protein KQX54_011141 [Cotesia glomerata]|uniref:Uncharacterized protein n=2 Tax=Cotesia glomerata TaxID=32391 RepID=A0AAV7I0T7_COTGL|nr:hypothetical protein KQX54_011141 [Cotesia glomerata]